MNSKDCHDDKDALYARLSWLANRNANFCTAAAVPVPVLGRFDEDDFEASCSSRRGSRTIMASSCSACDELNESALLLAVTLGRLALGGSAGDEIGTPATTERVRVGQFSGRLALCGR